MKTLTIIKTLTVSFLVAACAQTDFAGDSGQGFRSGKKTPPGTSNGTPGTPGTNNNPSNPVITTDDGGKIEVVEAELKLDRLTDKAKYRNCLYAHIVGEPPVALDCNRNASDAKINPAGNVKIKLKTNTCNQLRIYFESTNRPDPKTISTAILGQVSFGQSKQGRSIPGPGLNVIKKPASYLLEANDNGDNDWWDVSLRITPPANQPNIKFTIENSGLGCQ